MPRLGGLPRAPRPLWVLRWAPVAALLWRTGVSPCPAFLGSGLPRAGFPWSSLRSGGRAGSGRCAAVSSFQDLPLSKEAQAAIQDLGYDRLTEVQQQTFGPISEGQDLVVRAKTGAGKTLSFLLPTMDGLHKSQQSGIRILVLSPVRELSMQIHAEANKLALQFPSVQPILMVGGSNWEEDMKALDAASGGIILIATPGRLQTHLTKTPSFAKRLSEVQTLILDEVDQLCGELFAEVTGSIVRAVSVGCQHLFYSATITDEVTKVIEEVSQNHAMVDVEGPESTVPEAIVQTYKVVPTAEMSGALWKAVATARDYLSPPKIVVIFITGRIAAYYAEAFRQTGDLEVFEIHSRMKQQERSAQSEAFRFAAEGMLFTSDVTSRGLDYPGVTAVIQLGAPDSRYEYVHRVGRTGRQEAEGLGVLLLHDFEADWLENLEGLPVEEARWQESLHTPELRTLDIPTNVKAQAYYSRINHALRHPEGVDVLEVFRDAYRFAASIGALDGDSKPPALTEQNAQRYGVADISDPAVHIVKEVKSKVAISYQIMSAAEVHHAIGSLFEETLKDHSKVVLHFVSGDLAKYYAEILRTDEVFEAHSAVSKKVRKKILQSFDAAEQGALFTAGLSPATLPCTGVTAVILVGLPSSAKDAKQLLDFIARCGKDGGEVTSYLLAAPFEAEGPIGLLGDADLSATLKLLPTQREVQPVHEKLVSKAYFTWLRHYGLHPHLPGSSKPSLIREARGFAEALGTAETPPLPRRMAEDMGLAGVDDETLNVVE